MKKKQLQSTSITLVSRQTEIRGDLTFSGALEVEGRIIGQIVTDNQAAAEVRVHESGEIQGEIRAPRVIINGRVEGDVYASEHLELAAKARVQGSVYYTSMEMVMGAEVNGSLSKNEDKEIMRLGHDPQVAGTDVAENEDGDNT